MFMSYTTIGTHSSPANLCLLDMCMRMDRFKNQFLTKNDNF